VNLILFYCVKKGKGGKFGQEFEARELQGLIQADTWRGEGHLLAEIEVRRKARKTGVDYG
jgi:hypothetical protein